MGLRSWIGSWFKSEPKELWGVYAPEERLIFTFSNGKKLIRADPMVLYQRVAARGGDIESVSKIASSTLLKPEVVTQAHQDLVRYVRDIFELDKPEGLDCSTCLTGPECIDLLDTFYTFVGAKKKSTSPTATPPKATSATTPTSSAANPAFQNSSVSGSTASAPSTESPAPSPSESPLPSDSSVPVSATSSP